MKKRSSRTRARPGTWKAAEWKALAAIPLPRQGVARGQAATDPAPAAHALARALRHRATLRRVDLPEFTERAQGFLFVSQHTGAVVVELDGPVAQRFGDVAPFGQGAWLLNPAAGESAVSFKVGEVELALSVANGKVTFSERQAGVAGRDEVLPAPPVRPWCRQWPHERWLAAAAADLAQGASAVSRAAAAGLLVRLWRGVEAPATLEQMVAGRWPGQAALDWFSGLPPSTKDEVAKAVAAESEALRAGLKTLTAACARSPTGSRTDVLEWLHNRDNLESAAACWGEKRPRSLQRALAQLDDSARAEGAVFALHQFPGDARLRAVLERDPEAWWGQCAQG